MLAIAVGLSMDALAVSLTACVVWEGDRLKNALKMAFSFGLFQAVMPLIGYFGGTFMGRFVNEFDKWIAFGLLTVVGLKMVIEAIKKGDGGECIKEPLTLYALLVLSIATSIDAFAVGISLALLSLPILLSVLLIGSTTFILSFTGAFVGDRFAMLLGRRTEVGGGILLVLMGIKALL